MRPRSITDNRLSGQPASCPSWRPLIFLYSAQDTLFFFVRAAAGISLIDGRHATQKTESGATIIHHSWKAMSSTPILNAQGQPIRSALKSEDDVARTPPSGPVKGEFSPQLLGSLITACLFSF